MYVVAPPTRSMRHGGRVAVAIAATVAVVGCRFGTEYVPQTPGRATIGFERNRVGIYKNGVFTVLHDGPPASLSCSPQAAAEAATASKAARDAHSNEMAGNVINSFIWLFPPVVILGMVFLSLADDDHHLSYARAVDAVNLNNDTATCMNAAPGAPGAPGGSR